MTSWEITKRVFKGDYIYAVVKNHPNATKYGYVLEHRIVMENKLGRLLGKNEVVHHIDENKRNNDPDNLELKTRSDHTKHHKQGTAKPLVNLICPYCKKAFARRRGQTYLVKKTKNTFCSRSCNGKYAEQKSSIIWK
jgi:hypothetical protein